MSSKQIFPTFFFFFFHIASSLSNGISVMSASCLTLNTEKTKVHDSIEIKERRNTLKLTLVKLITRGKVMLGQSCYRIKALFIEICVCIHSCCVPVITFPVVSRHDFCERTNLGCEPELILLKRDPGGLYAM